MTRPDLRTHGMSSPPHVPSLPITSQRQTVGNMGNIGHMGKNGTMEKTSLLNISNLLRVRTGVTAGQLSTAAGQSAYCLLTMELREEKAVVE